jgi:hypothetical protein
MLILTLISTVAPISTAQAGPNKRSSLTLTFDPIDFPEHAPNGATLRANYELVAKDALLTVSGMFAHEAPPESRPIVLKLSDTPRADVTSDPNRIIIYLALPESSLYGMDYTRFTYQLCHELGHIWMGARRTNGLIEMLADAVSLEALDRMAVLWSVKYADFPAWADFAPNFRTYRQRVEEVSIATLPKHVRGATSDDDWKTVAGYMRKETGGLDKTPYASNAYPLRTLGAMALRSREVDWTAFVNITAATSPSPTKDSRYREDLPVRLETLAPAARSGLARAGW